MINSIKKNIKGIVLILISAVCVCIGQLFWKLSSGSNLYLMLIGFILYGLGAIIMILAYKFGELSVIQPMLSVNYVFSIILGALILRENITIFKIAGVIVITFGVILIAGGDE